MIHNGLKSYCKNEDQNQIIIIKKEREKDGEQKKRKLSSNKIDE